ncbi:uncharacterized protein KY384_002072 [Bacidia gigantensis]|uniref:uncharacterized protein n=1 Tax=Bacidia gigantensis TaxID=2732470 RepID=UPI001D03648E|nr:uncharacterized protein KY384_002072 [Bacidia gigantensis]KAG8533289.1 hypothetical protein KY384_002072 [Bacidia gigantensis]
MVHKPSSRGRINGDSVHKPDDLESAISSTRRRPQFQDIANLAVQNHFHAELKRKLKEGVDHDGLEKYRKSVSEIKKLKNKKVRVFYEAQNDRLSDWLEVDAVVASMADDVLDSMRPQDTDGDGVAEQGGKLMDTRGDIDPLLPHDERERRRTGEKRAKWAININIIANILLLAAKGVAALKSDSLSLIASLVDSALDLLCTLIIFTTNKLVAWKIKRLRHKFPVGRRRLEPLGIVVFSIIMIVSFLQILQESVSKLLPGPGPKVAAQLPPTAIGALVATVVVKGIIWIGCVPIKTTQVQALAQDCKTDVVFNTFSLLFPLIGHSFHLWWLDPVGAALLSLFIIYDWAETLFENVARLTGAAVDDRVLKKLMFMAWRFAPVVEAFKAVTAYHAGDGVWVEMDVLMPEETRLGKAHDVAETLQYCLEGLTEVDRAFVSVDYTSEGPTGHAEESR